MKKIKNENQILIMLALFSISVGLWGNFRQLWLQDNNFSVTNISNTKYRNINKCYNYWFNWKIHKIR